MSGWVGEKIEEDEAVGMRCCGSYMGGWFSSSFFSRKVGGLMGR